MGAAGFEPATSRCEARLERLKRAQETALESQLRWWSRQRGSARVSGFVADSAPKPPVGKNPRLLSYSLAPGENFCSALAPDSPSAPTRGGARPRPSQRRDRN